MVSQRIVEAARCLTERTGIQQRIALGADGGQGCLFGRPEPAEKLSIEAAAHALDLEKKSA